MSRRHRHRPRDAKVHASLFAALGDETRLAMLAALAQGTPQSISRLAEGTALTRQAVTKHLRLLEGAGLVQSARAGRERQFALNTKTLDDLRDYLNTISRQWDDALARLKAFAEREAGTSRGGS